MAGNYIKEQQQQHIPRGSKSSHPIDWKGQQKKKNIKIPPITNIADLRRPIVSPGGRKEHLTEKQIATAKFMMLGYTARQAKLKAGYAESTVNKKGVMQDNRKLQTFFETMQSKFLKEVGTDYVAGKMKEWFEAEKYVGKEATPVPDAQTQMMAFDRWKEIVMPKEQIQPQKKREMVLTEWIGGDEKPGDNSELPPNG